MPVGLQAEIRRATVTFRPQVFARPLVLSSGPITEVTEAAATVWVRVGEVEAVGRGSIPLSDLWSWPEGVLGHVRRDGVMRGLCLRLAERLRDACGGEPAHPLELGLRLHDAAMTMAAEDAEADPPTLARAVCLSPFDAAIHDAVGHALGCSALAIYDLPGVVPSADGLFPDGTCAAVRRLLLPSSRTSLDAWLIVGKADTFEDIRPWMVERGYRCFKLKVMGRDPGEDARRVAEVFGWARSLGAIAPRLTVDSNEGNPDVAGVRAFLDQLAADAPDTLRALEYLEQPTARDIRTHAHDWHAVAGIKPVLLDEGLTGLDLLPLVTEQGWSGLALKTCKGHSFTLVAAAWARQRGLLLAMQDLTNAGLGAIHSALTAACLPTCNGVELNSPQFTPAANLPWLPRLAGLLDPRGGVHRLPAPLPMGLGSLL